MRLPYVDKGFLGRFLSRLKRSCSFSRGSKSVTKSYTYSKWPATNREEKSTSEPDQKITDSIDSVEISYSIAANTGTFMNLPGEVRNLIYNFAFNTSFSTDQLPDTHLLPSCYLLALTCRQIYHEVHEMIDSNVLVYGLHAMRIRFFQQLAPEKLRLMKAVILPESRMGDSWIRYHDWRNGIYQCVVDKLCTSGFHPTILVFCTDCQRSQLTGHVTGVSQEARAARFANALKDLRFALSVLRTIHTVYLVDVGMNATRDLYADMFEKFFPNDVDKVQRIAQGFNSLYYHGTIDGSEKWDVHREREPLPSEGTAPRDSDGIVHGLSYLRFEEASNKDNTTDFCLTKANPDLPSSEVAVHIFPSWPDFCSAYDGPYRSPKRWRNPTHQDTPTKYNMRQPSWHLGQDV
jgi:hypothetical protein